MLAILVAAECSSYQRGCFLAWKQYAGKTHILQEHQTEVSQLDAEVSRSQMREKIRIEGLTTKYLKLWAGIHVRECHGRRIAELVLQIAYERVCKRIQVRRFKFVFDCCI